MYRRKKEGKKSTQKNPPKMKPHQNTLELKEAKRVKRLKG